MTGPTKREIATGPILYGQDLLRARNILSKLKNHRDAGPFLEPVDAIALNVPTYYEVIKNPMDFAAIARKLRGVGGGYESIEEFESEVRLIFRNCAFFNAPDTPVALMGVRLEAFFNKLWNAPWPPKSKGKNARQRKPQRPPVSGIEVAVPETSTGVDDDDASMDSGDELDGDEVSHHTIDHSADHSTVVSPTAADGPASSVSSPGAVLRPEGLSREESKACGEVLKKMMSQKESWPFLQPVDAIALGVPDYYKVVKNPMDLATAGTKLRSGHYNSVEEFVADLKLIFTNCLSFNAPDTPVYEAGARMLQTLEKSCASKLGKFYPTTPSAANRVSAARGPAAIDRSPVGETPEPKRRKTEPTDDASVDSPGLANAIPKIKLKISLPKPT